MKTSKRKISSISNIEADILLVIWDKGKATVREVHEKLLEKEYEKKEDGFLPYTTVLSAMGNLVLFFWENSNIEAKDKLLPIVFPEGIYYKDKKVGTTKIPTILRVLKSENSKKSAMVAHSILISNTLLEEMNNFRYT